MTVLEVDREQVLAYRIAAHGLRRDGTAVADLAVLDIGLQDSGAGAAEIALAARITGPPPPIGPGHHLALVWSLRGAPYVHRRRDLNGLAGALWPLSEADAVGRLDAAASVRKAGLTCLDAYGITVSALREMVTAPTPKGAASAGVTRRVPEALTRDCRACGARHVFELPFRFAALPAGLELDPSESPPVLLPRRSAAVVDGLDKAALRRLILGYLTVLGPASAADVAGYLGARRADLARVWPDDLTEVRVNGEKDTRWLPSDQVATLRRPPEPDLVRLIGGFDPWMQARDRTLIVPDATLHKPLWPVLGRPGVLLVDGEVLGYWRPKSAGRRLTVTVTASVPLSAAVRDRIDTEAEILAAVRGADAVTVRHLS